MYRVNYDDWDRKKTYLIRSLFHDLPLLSPVYESRESSCSPTGVTSRPCSPLPPLTIEKMPNPHDEPPEFYSELERKMKKVYRKLLFNEDSMSVHSILARYSGGVVYYENSDEIDDQGEVPSSDTSVTEKLVTAIEATNISKSLPSVQINSNVSHTKTSSNDDDSDNDVAIADDNLNNDVSYEGDTTSNSEGLVDSQITTVKALVHRVPSVTDQDINREQGTGSSVYESEQLSLSPLLTCHSLAACKSQAVKTNIETATVSNKRSEDDRENLKQDQALQNNLIEEMKEYEVTPDSTEKSSSNDTLETMRRQLTISSSFGSIQYPADDYFDTTLGKNIEFSRRTSYEIHFEHENSLQEIVTHRNTEPFPDDDFSNILSTPSLKIKRKRRNMTSKRLIDDFNSDDVDFVTKRQKAKDTGVQATLFSDEYESNGWDYLKTNFFVGVPKVYKLCICKNHLCRKE